MSAALFVFRFLFLAANRVNCILHPPKIKDKECKEGRFKVHWVRNEKMIAGVFLLLE